MTNNFKLEAVGQKQAWSVCPRVLDCVDGAAPSGVEAPWLHSRIWGYKDPAGSWCWFLLSVFLKLLLTRWWQGGYNPCPFPWAQG